jgi:hypothetical protein
LEVIVIVGIPCGKTARAVEALVVAGVAQVALLVNVSPTTSPTPGAYVKELEAAATAVPFTVHEYVGDDPPFVIIELIVIELPAHTVSLAKITTEGVTSELTVTVVVPDMPPTHPVPAFVATTE